MSRLQIKNYHESGHMVKYKIRIHHVLSKNSDMVKLKKLFIPCHFLKNKIKRACHIENLNRDMLFYLI